MRTALVLSIALNVALSVVALYLAVTGYAASPHGALGVLTRDVPVGVFGGSTKLFVLPKGLLVRDASASGADWFEPHRFRIVVTSDRTDLVRYPPPELKPNDSEFYSADITHNPQADSGAK
jgi:hypothetical protein